MLNNAVCCFQFRAVHPTAVILSVCRCAHLSAPPPVARETAARTASKAASVIRATC